MRMLIVLLGLACFGCGNQSVPEQEKELSATVSNNLSHLPMNTNDPLRGRDPGARVDAEGETGVGSGVQQKPLTNPSK